MALTEQQIRDVNIALGDSFNSEQKKNLIVALGNVGGEDPAPPLEAGPGLNISENTISLDLATPAEVGGVVQVGEYDLLEEFGADATDLATALVLLNSLKANYNELLTALADGFVIQPTSG